MTSSDNYAVFKIFTDVDQAEELAVDLKKNKIDCRLVDNSPPVDITFTGNTLDNEVQVLIKQSDFVTARKVLEEQAEQLLGQIDKDYYLFEFTNEELFEILLKPDEWCALDYRLARKILNERGKDINDDLINSLRKQRLDDLAKPEQGQKPWIVIGYMFSIIGGLIGVFIGWYLQNYKKTLPDGRKVYAFSDSDRKNGKYIFSIGIFFFMAWQSLWIIIRFL
jgi:hypothetical protein